MNHLIKMFYYFILYKFIRLWFRILVKINRLCWHIPFINYDFRDWRFKGEFNLYRQVVNERLQWWDTRAKRYYCNMCGKLVVYGIVNHPMIMNCPHCGCQYGLNPIFPVHIFDRKNVRHTCGDKNKFTDETFYKLYGMKER